MSGYPAAVPLLRTRFAEQWALLRPTVPVLMPNSEKSFDGSVFVAPASGPHARLTFMSDRSSESIAAGDDTPVRIYGTVQLEIFVPTFSGDLLGY
ncbi:MAG: hypothetical protein ABI639_17585, partial [Thermoanaerobaculia bacterium]